MVLLIAYEYVTEAKNMLPIGNSIEQKMVLQDIHKIEIKLNMKFKKMDMQNDMKNKIESSILLKEKKSELIKARNYLKVLTFLPKSDDVDKRIQEVSDKKFALIKELMMAETIDDFNSGNSNSGNSNSGNSDNSGNSGNSGNTGKGLLFPHGHFELTAGVAKANGEP